MSLQQQWEALCRAYEARDWEELELLLPQVKEKLEAGQSPVVSPIAGEAFNLALARAGVVYIYSHFTKTTEWPTIEPAADSQDLFEEGA